MADFGDVRVLLVDDDPMLLSLLARGLSRRGLQVLTAGSPAEALEVMERSTPHVLVSDQNMPQGEGTNLLETVEERYPSVLRVMMTGYPDPGVASRAIGTAHVYRFLVKPVRADDIVRVIEHAQRDHSLVDSA